MGLVADAYGGQAAVGTLGVLLLAVTAVLFVTQGQLRRMQ
jgi:hypothetical protein